MEIPILSKLIKIIIALRKKLKKKKIKKVMIRKKLKKINQYGKDGKKL